MVRGWSEEHVGVGGVGDRAMHDAFDPYVGQNQNPLECLRQPRGDLVVIGGKEWVLALGPDHRFGIGEVIERIDLGGFRGADQLDRVTDIAPNPQLGSQRVTS